MRAFWLPPFGTSYASFRAVLVAGTSAARCDAPVGAGTREDGGTRGALEDGGTSGELEAGATTDALEDGISSAAGN